MKHKRLDEFQERKPAGHTGALKVFAHSFEWWAGRTRRVRAARWEKKQADAAAKVEKAGPRGKVNSRPKHWSPTLARKMEFLRCIGVV